MVQDEKGIWKISTFVTADALLAAVLMVWAQLWIQPSVRLWAAWYGSANQTEEVSKVLQTFDLNVGVGLIWTYLAVFLALLALVWVSWSSLNNRHNDKVPNSAVNLFLFSVSMALGDILQSVISVSIKVLSPSYLIWDPLRLPFSVLPGVALFAPTLWYLYKRFLNRVNKNKG